MRAVVDLIGMYNYDNTVLDLMMANMTSKIDYLKEIYKK